MKDLFSVAGKVGIVTGGSRGIGEMIAKGLVESGVRTYITARKIEALKATQESLSQFGECIAIAADLSTVEGITAFVNEFTEREKNLHILVNNAGATWGADLDEFPESGWDRVMNLNVKSIFFLIQKFLPILRETGTAEDPARVINISSINAFRNSKMTNYSYTASKAAVVRMTEHLAAELVGQHINVNCIAPGVFPSQMTFYFLKGHEEQVASSIPLGRYGQTEDIAGPVIFLSSRASAMVVGATIIADGGLVTTA